MVNIKKKDIESVQIIVEKEVENLTSQSVATVDDFLRPIQDAVGSFEGTLKIVTAVHGFNFFVYDSTGHRVACNLTKNIKENDVFQAFNQRVAVYGIVKYRKDGLASVVEVEELRVFKNEDELPTHKQMQGIFKVQ